MDKSKLTYAIWPWGTAKREQMELAAKEVTEIGYKTFESVKAAIYAYDLDLAAYKEVLVKYGLKPVSFYFHLPKKGEEETGLFANYEKELDFVAKLDVKLVTLQGTSGHPEGKLSESDLAFELETLCKFALKAKEFGITSNLHPHNNTWVMYENEIDYMMQNSSPGLLFFAPDTAHLVRGGCDPAAVIERYAKRVKFTHFKDIKYGTTLKSDGVSAAGMEVYSNFLELGTGNVDFRKVFDILKSAGYDGYLCAELDKAPVSNAASAKVNYDYLINNY
ncbi:MAG: sugar phosphate isomerase/epimerase [Eubacteriales bacterium]|nr:sugar phosphate isomerase/epimerase [Eubacteriales bacterium]